ncbi:FAD-dependent oxidoreductase [Pseudonocardia spinosispora]|uniref:FAD-dependent oxidoreductase n=1 Tax=Pseudonocardia spinosispora TaxID=103441 RepID=UPI0003F9B366
MSGLRVAVVGTGPAGMYALGHLLGNDADIVESVTVLDRLPTPFGLVRAGVAPDHQKTKKVQVGFGRLLRNPRVRCHFNVAIGSDISHAELRSHHHAVVYAVGASGSRQLGIPGEDKAGSHTATEFVAWYNGHPDFSGRSFDLTSPRVVVVGNGNVALDIARVLTWPVDELTRTDIADHALAALRDSRVEEVVLLARRGPDTAAFTSPELLALTQRDDVDVVVEGDLGDGAEPRAYGDRLKLRLLRELAEREPRGARRRIVFRFLSSPVDILGGDRASGIRVCHNELRDGRAVPTDTTTDLDTGLVLRSIGYRGQPIDGLPFDQRSGTVPHTGGRVEPGVYVAGWIKRGPTGVIGTNKHDAAETVRALLDDARAGHLPDPVDGFDSLVTDRAADPIGIDGWTAIDTHERRQGAALHRPRVKLTDLPQLLAHAR